jgi:hypothetical protein
VLDGQGHTLKFRLKKGGLLGMYLGNATIKNASFIYADETLTTASGAKWKEGDGGYGLFGFMVMGRSVLDNCYFERTNNDYEKASVFGLVARPRGNLVLQNTVIYGFRFNSNASYYPNDITISTSSTNAYVVGGRKDAKVDITTFKMIENFTKVYTNGTGSAADVRGPLATDVADASGFNECWTKGEYITWKGAQDTAFSSVVKAQ